MIRWLMRTEAVATARDNADRWGAAALGLLAIHFVLACAGNRPSLEQSVATAQSALRGVSVAGAEAAPAWADQVDARIAYCKRQQLPDTEQARADCMGPFGEGDRFEDELEAFKDAYDEAAEAAQRMRQAARALDGMLEGNAP